MNKQLKQAAIVAWIGFALLIAIMISHFICLFLSIESIGASDMLKNYTQQLFVILLVAFVSVMAGQSATKLTKSASDRTSDKAIKTGKTASILLIVDGVLCCGLDAMFIYFSFGNTFYRIPENMAFLEYIDNAAFAAGIMLIIAGAVAYKELKNGAAQNGDNGYTSVTTETTGTTETTPVAQEYADVAAVAEEPAEEPDLEKGVAQIKSVDRVQSKIGTKGKKGIMITLIVSYALLLLAGILLASVPDASGIISGIGICEKTAERAYGITIGVMWVALVPTFGYYFATVSPFRISKKAKIIIALITSAFLVAMNAVFFVIIGSVTIDNVPVKEFFEGDDSWFIPLSMVFASLGMAICYLLMLFRGNTASIKEINTQTTGDGAVSQVKGVLLKILNGILLFVRFILIIKEKYPDVFILVMTLLMTWLVFFTAFIFAIVCIVLLVGVIILYFCKVYDMAKPNVNSDMKEYRFTNDMGFTETVYSSDGHTFYDAAGSVRGESDGHGGIILK